MTYLVYTLPTKRFTYVLYSDVVLVLEDYSTNGCMAHGIGYPWLFEMTCHSHLVISLSLEPWYIGVESLLSFATALPCICHISYLVTILV